MRSFLGRWPEGFRCPSCCGTDAWPTARGQLRCNRCQRPSVTAGTIALESQRYCSVRSGILGLGIRPPGLGDKCEAGAGSPGRRGRVDETYRPASSRRARRDFRGRDTGRIRMSRRDVAARSLITENWATVRTDGWSAYSGLANQGYDHQPRSISAGMPMMHRVAALLDVRSMPNLGRSLSDSIAAVCSFSSGRRQGPSNGSSQPRKPRGY